MADATNDASNMSIISSSSSSTTTITTINTHSANATNSTTASVLGVRIKQEKVTPPASPQRRDEVDDKSTIGPVKSSKQILDELFQTFSVAVPDELISDPTPTAHRHKKHKREKRHKKSKHRDRDETTTGDGGGGNGDGSDVGDSVERRAKRIKKEKRDKDDDVDGGGGGSRRREEKRARVGYPGDEDDQVSESTKRIKREKISPPRQQPQPEATAATSKTSKVFKSSGASAALLAGKPRIVIKSLKESAVFRDAEDADSRRSAAYQQQQQRDQRDHHRDHHHHRDERRRGDGGGGTRRADDGDLSLSDEETYQREKDRYYDGDRSASRADRSRRRKSGDSERSRDRDRDHRDQRDRRDRQRGGSASGSRRRDDESTSSATTGGGGDGTERIDKRRLLEVARRNAIQMLESGKLPGAQHISAEAREKVLAKMRFGGKSVDELTEFCKKLSSGDAGSGYLSNVSDSEAVGGGGGRGDDDSDDADDSDAERERAERAKERAFNHPFVLRDKAPIVMNIRNSVPIQPKSAEQTKAILMQYPVSSGQHHRLNESEWVPVASGSGRRAQVHASAQAAPVKSAPVVVAAAPAPKVPIAPQTGQLEQQVQDYQQQLNRYAEQRKQLEQSQKPPQRQHETPPPPQHSAGSGQRQEQHQQEQQQQRQSSHNPFKSGASSKSQYGEQQQQQQQQQQANIFANSSSNSNLDVTSIISQRLNAMRKLQDNPHDSEAIRSMYNAQKDMSSWASSKFVPGQFTGSTGANILSSRELTSGFQAWAKRSDQHANDVAAAAAADDDHNHRHQYDERFSNSPQHAAQPPPFHAGTNHWPTAGRSNEPQPERPVHDRPQDQHQLRQQVQQQQNNPQQHHPQQQQHNHPPPTNRQPPPHPHRRSSSPCSSLSLSDWVPSTSEDDDDPADVQRREQRKLRRAAAIKTAPTKPAAATSALPNAAFAASTSSAQPSIPPLMAGPDPRRTINNQRNPFAKDIASVVTPAQSAHTEQAVVNRLALYRRAADQISAERVPVSKPPPTVPLLAEPPTTPQQKHASATYLIPGRPHPKGAINFVRAGVAPLANKSRFGPITDGGGGTVAGCSDRIEGTITPANPQVGASRSPPPLHAQPRGPSTAAQSAGPSKNPFHAKPLMITPVVAAAPPPVRAAGAPVAVGPFGAKNPFAGGGDGGGPVVSAPANQPLRTAPLLTSGPPPPTNRFVGAAAPAPRQPLINAPANGPASKPFRAPQLAVPEPRRFNDADPDRCGPFNGPQNTGGPMRPNNPFSWQAAGNNNFNRSPNNQPQAAAAVQIPPMPPLQPMRHRANAPNPFNEPPSNTGPIMHGNRFNGGPRDDQCFDDNFRPDGPPQLFNRRPPMDNRSSNNCGDNNDDWTPSPNFDADMGPNGPNGRRTGFANGPADRVGRALSSPGVALSLAQQMPPDLAAALLSIVGAAGQLPNMPQFAGGGPGPNRNNGPMRQFDGPGGGSNSGNNNHNNNNNNTNGPMPFDGPNGPNGGHNHNGQMDFQGPAQNHRRGGRGGRCNSRQRHNMFRNQRNDFNDDFRDDGPQQFNADFDNGDGDSFGNGSGGFNEFDNEMGGNDFGNDFGNSFDNEFGNNCVNDFGNDFGNEFGNDFGNDFGNNFGNEFGNNGNMDFGPNGPNDGPNEPSFMPHNQHHPNNRRNRQNRMHAFNNAPNNQNDCGSPPPQPPNGGCGPTDAMQAKPWWTAQIADLWRAKQNAYRGLGLARKRNDRAYMVNFKRIGTQLRAAISEQKQRCAGGGSRGGIAMQAEEEPERQQEVEAEEEEFDDDCI